MLELTAVNVLLVLGAFVSGFILGMQWKDEDLD